MASFLLRHPALLLPALLFCAPAAVLAGVTLITLTITGPLYLLGLL
ncbi:hypothetical protein RWV98_08160 [Agathobaculum sp. NTUH-O15-33]|nr:hypothetical protein [Agathobaculum sp. NTUH-O15-33]WNX86230.1 hypothetical protein RWV98_08160 [Agathobaculum sp. NTUH-O15-33]